MRRDHLVPTRYIKSPKILSLFKDQHDMLYVRREIIYY